jgi:chromate transporter
MNDAAPRPSFAELTAASFKIGCLGFGGPAGQIALMHRVFVEEKRWIDEPRYLHALNFCMLLPGPEAQQLAVYVGWLLHGVRGGLVAGALFVIPGAVVVFGLSWLYAEHAALPAVAALFYGVKAAVLALVAEALVRIGRRAVKANADLAIAAAAFVALYVLGAPFPLVIVAAGLLGAVRARGASAAATKNERHPGPRVRAFGAPQDRLRGVRDDVDYDLSTEEIRQPSARGTLAAAALWGGLWLAPVLAVFLLLGPDHVLSEVGALFSQLAVVTFGGAYAVLAYLQQQAVESQGWLTAAQMIDGLGLAETTPGPLVLVNQFVGFQAGWSAGGGPGSMNLGLATLCAVMASWCTFAPSYLFIFAFAPFAESLRTNRVAAGALAAITAAVLGVIASLAAWFALHVVFTRTADVASPWGTELGRPELASFDPVAAALALAAGVALIRFKASMLVVIAACAAAGAAARLAGWGGP